MGYVSGSFKTEELGDTEVVEVVRLRDARSHCVKSLTISATNADERYEKYTKSKSFTALPQGVQS